MEGQLSKTVNELVWLWSTHKNEYLSIVPQAVIDKIQELVDILPKMFTARVTGRRSINIDNFEDYKNGYMEFEVFKDYTECLYVPGERGKHDYGIATTLSIPNTHRAYAKRVERFVVEHGI